MCKLYIETSDLDAVVEQYVENGGEPTKGRAIQLLKSESLTRFAERAAMLEGLFPNHTLHAVTAGILIGLKLAESGLELDTLASTFRDTLEEGLLDMIGRAKLICKLVLDIYIKKSV